MFVFCGFKSQGMLLFMTKYQYLGARTLASTIERHDEIPGGSICEWLTFTTRRLLASRSHGGRTGMGCESCRPKLCDI